MRTATRYAIAALENQKDTNNIMTQAFTASMTGNYVDPVFYTPVQSYNTDMTDDVEVCEEVFRNEQDGNTPAYSMIIGDIVHILDEDGTNKIYRLMVVDHIEQWVLLDTVTNNEKEEEKEVFTMNTNTTNNNATTNNTVQEGTDMREFIINGNNAESITDTVAEDIAKAQGKIYQGAQAAFNFVGTEKSKVEQALNDDVEHLKANMAGIIGILDVVGIVSLKKSIEDIIAVGVDSASKGTLGSLSDMAAECTRKIENEIEFLEMLGDEDDIKKVLTLKKFVNKAGQECRGKNIFEAFFGALYWIARTVCKKLKEWFGIDTSKMPKVLQLVFGAFKFVLDLVLTGVRIVFKFGAWGAGLVVASVIKVGMWVWNTVSKLFAKAKELGNNFLNTESVAQ